MLRKQSGSQGGATFGLNLKHASKKKYKNFCYIDEPYAEKKSSSRRQKSWGILCGLCFFNLGVWEQIN